jgi:hypothetical protein
MRPEGAMEKFSDYSNGEDDVEIKKYLLLWHAFPVNPGKHSQFPDFLLQMPALEHSDFWCALSTA